LNEAEIRKSGKQGALSFPWKRESSLFGSCGFRIKCGMTGPKAHLEICYLKKQSQFSKAQNDVNYLMTMI
jgi:hypothetical protein